MQPFVFWTLSAAAVGAALVTISHRNPLTCAIALTLCLAAVAGLFATLAADFLFVVQLLVYAGAVMVLVVYVIMLLNLRDRDLIPLGISKPRAFLGGLAAVLLVSLLAAAQSSTSMTDLSVDDPGFGGVGPIAEMLFTQYVYPFEVISVLLLAAVLGEVVLAMKRF